jgi:hypothetical protein
MAAEMAANLVLAWEHPRPTVRLEAASRLAAQAELLVRGLVFRATEPRQRKAGAKMRGEGWQTVARNLWGLDTDGRLVQGPRSAAAVHQHFVGRGHMVPWRVPLLRNALQTFCRNYLRHHPAGVATPADLSWARPRYR